MASRRPIALLPCLLLLAARCSSGERQIHISTLLERSRRLEQDQAAEENLDDAAAQAADDDGNQYFPYDLTQFSLRFEKCQYVKMYDDEIAQDEDSDSPLALKHFVVYKLCPTDSCTSTSCGLDASSSSSGGSGGEGSTSSSVVYGKYTVPVDDYLKYAVEDKRRQLENACRQCDEGCTNDDELQACQQQAEAGDDAQAAEGQQGCGILCSECEESCYFYENLEGNGYADASNYIECQKLEIQQQQEDGEGGRRRANRRAQEEENGDAQQLYVGPRCNENGKIVIGVFADERCWKPSYEDVESLLGLKLSYHLLNESYAENQGCLSCKEQSDDRNERDEEDEDEVAEVCEKVYAASAKCESGTGLQVGFVQMSREEEDYENQAENEFLACTFINSLIWNSYTEEGEINVKAPQDEIVRVVTKKQTIAMSLLGCTIALILALTFYLDRKINQLQLSYPLVSKGEGAVV